MWTGWDENDIHFVFILFSRKKQVVFLLKTSCFSVENKMFFP